MPIADILICVVPSYGSVPRCPTYGTVPWRFPALGFDWRGPPACGSIRLGRPVVSSLYLNCKGEEIVLIVISKVTFVMEEEHPSSQFL